MTSILWAEGIEGGVRFGTIEHREASTDSAVSLVLPDPLAIALTSKDIDVRESIGETVVDWPAGNAGTVDVHVPRANVAGTMVTWAFGDSSRDAVDFPLDGLPGEVGLRKSLLPNGLTVLTKERPDSESVGIAIAVRAGSRDENDQTSGGSHWLEHAHFLGTTRRPSNQAVFGAIEAVGGDLNATTSWELTDYIYAVPADQLHLALDVAADMLLQSTFPEEAFDRERKVVFEELNRRANSPGTLATDTFYSTVFRTHPARRLIGGTKESVRDIPLRTILDYRTERYVAGNMTAAIVGNTKHDVAVLAMSKAFAKLPTGGWINREFETEAFPTERRDIRLSLGEKQAHILIGGVAPGIASEDLEAYVVLDSILDRTGRRLATEIRDKRGLAISVGSDYFGLVDAAAWAVSALTSVENLDQVQTLMLEELRKIRDELVERSDIEDAVRSIRGRKFISDEMNLGQARRLARDAALEQLEPTDLSMERFDAVTPEDVQRAARKYLDLENYTKVVVTF